MKGGKERKKRGESVDVDVVVVFFGISGHLVVLPYEGVNGKFNHQAPMIQVTPSPISTFDVSRFEDVLAAGTMDGKVRHGQLTAESRVMVLMIESNRYVYTAYSVSNPLLLLRSSPQHLS